jgi:hypothetical protein
MIRQNNKWSLAFKIIQYSSGAKVSTVVARGSSYIFRLLYHIKKGLVGVGLVMKRMKSFSFNLWMKARIRKDNIKKIHKIQKILYRTESKLSYPFLMQSKRNFSSSSISTNPFFISGFCDAESSFIISATKRSYMRTGWGVYPIFRIELHKRDLPLLKRIKAFFGVGNINESKIRDSVTFSVTSVKEINEVIIPHFDNYKLLTQKQVDFELFK